MSWQHSKDVRRFAVVLKKIEVQSEPFLHGSKEVLRYRPVRRHHVTVTNGSPLRMSECAVCGCGGHEGRDEGRRLRRCRPLQFARQKLSGESPARGDVTVKLERPPQAARKADVIEASTQQGALLEHPEVVARQQLQLVLHVAGMVETLQQMTQTGSDEDVPRITREGLHLAHDVGSEDARVTQLVDRAPVGVDADLKGVIQKLTERDVVSADEPLKLENVGGEHRR